LHVDPVSVQAQIDELGEIGAGPDGLYRPVYGDAWVEAIGLLGQWFRDAGLDTRQDAMAT